MKKCDEQSWFDTPAASEPSLITVILFVIIKILVLVLDHDPYHNGNGDSDGNLDGVSLQNLEEGEFAREERRFCFKQQPKIRVSRISDASSNLHL